MLKYLKQLAWTIYLAIWSFFKNSAKVLANPITDLCNLLITSGKFPEFCKVAKVKPIYKKASVTEESNYRPISLLPLTSKVL